MHTQASMHTQDSMHTQGPMQTHRNDLPDEQTINKQTAESYAKLTKSFHSQNLCIQMAESNAI